MQGYNWSFVLLNIATVATFILLLLITTTRNKKELHFFSWSMAFWVFIWSLGMLAEIYAQTYFQYEGMLFTNIYFTAVNFVPFCIFFLGITFANVEIKRHYYALFLVPLTSTIILWTNPFHHLFFISFSLSSSEIVKGPYLIAETFLSYLLIAVGLYNLIYFSIKNSGFFSRQSLLIFFGSLVPVLVDVAFALDLFSFPLYFEPISFAIGAACFMLAILKFDFLNIVPIALQTIMDHISDSYIVINEVFEVVDYNRTLQETFEDIIHIRRKESVYDWLEQIESSQDRQRVFTTALQEAVSKKRSVFFEFEFANDRLNKFFNVEITPIFSGSNNKATIILLKDSTEQRRSFELIQQTQARLLESEHLASLGQMVGGIAHNLKTPIMSISGGLEGLIDLIEEYEESLGNPSVTKEDHLAIAGDMREWIAKMKGYCAYMSDVISTVKGQAVQLTASTTDKFVLRELLKRIDILMKHELKRFGCQLRANCLVDENTEIKGEVNSLVQVFNNLITNGIEAYEGQDGFIDLTISLHHDMMQFEVRDYGTGIPADVQDKLFKEMITTKAHHGTGLGLYMSYSTIWGRFGGKMWFESEEGRGTAFYIQIPLVTADVDAEVRV